MIDRDRLDDGATINGFRATDESGVWVVVVAGDRYNIDGNSRDVETDTLATFAVDTIPIRLDSMRGNQTGKYDPEEKNKNGPHRAGRASHTPHGRKPCLQELKEVHR